MKSESHVGSCASAPAQLAEPGGAWWSLVEPGGAWWSYRATVEAGTRDGGVARYDRSREPGDTPGIRSIYIIRTVRLGSFFKK